MFGGAVCGESADGQANIKKRVLTGQLSALSHGDGSCSDWVWVARVGCGMLNKFGLGDAIVDSQGGSTSVLRSVTRA